MSDPFWDEVKKKEAEALQRRGGVGIRLRGGPLDGWHVTEDAAVLQPDWSRTWPPLAAETSEPGRYEIARHQAEAEWRTLHPCRPPRDEAEHPPGDRWTCPECGASWRLEEVRGDARSLAEPAPPQVARPDWARD